MRPLDPEDAACVLALTRETIAPEVTKRLLDAARGNPLALVELPHLLTASQLAGTEVMLDPIPTGNRLERAFAARLLPLAPDGRLAVLVASADSSGAAGVVLEACRLLGLANGALDDVESLGLIRVGASSVKFRHPLVRSAAYHGAAAHDRRRVHAALAASDGDIDRRVWHLAAATVESDESIAAELDRAGDRALARGAPAAAAAALERAASLTARDELRGARLLRAAVRDGRGGESRP